MKVYVNEKIVTLFEGARVIDAIRSYVSDMGIKLPQPIPTITDQYGNEVDLEGRLSEGAKLVYKHQ